MKNISGALVAMAACLLSSGCASIVGGHNQSLSVDTQAKGAAVAGASCKLNNSKGTWYVTTPGSVIVRRAYGDLAVSCTHDQHPLGTASVKSSTKAMAFGNIIFGGAIGVGVDVATGAAYDYPSLISIELGLDQIAIDAAKAAEATKAAEAAKPAEVVKVADTPK